MIYLTLWLFCGIVAFVFFVMSDKERYLKLTSVEVVSFLVACAVFGWITLIFVILYLFNIVE